MNEQFFDAVMDGLLFSIAICFFGFILLRVSMFIVRVGEEGKRQRGEQSRYIAFPQEPLVVPTHRVLDLNDK